MIRRLKGQDYLDVLDLAKSCKDIFDFYVTKNNVRYLINHAEVIQRFLLNCEKWGEKNIGYYQKGVLVGIIFIVGYKEKSNRKYIKILIRNDDKKIGRNLLKALFWDYKKELWAKIRKSNRFLYNLLRSHDFQFKHGRGAEVLLYREGRTNDHNNQFNKGIA